MTITEIIEELKKLRDLPDFYSYYKCYKYGPGHWESTYYPEAIPEQLRESGEYRTHWAETEKNMKLGKAMELLQQIDKHENNPIQPRKR